MQCCLERKAVSGREAGQGQRAGREDTREYEGTEKGAESEKGTGMWEGDGKESDGEGSAGETGGGSEKTSLCAGGTGLDGTGPHWFSLISQPHPSTYLLRRSVSDAYPSLLSSCSPHTRILLDPSM